MGERRFERETAILEEGCIAFYIDATDKAVTAFGPGAHVVAVDGDTLQARASDGTVLVSVTRDGRSERRRDFLLALAGRVGE